MWFVGKQLLWPAPILTRKCVDPKMSLYYILSIICRIAFKTGFTLETNLFNSRRRQSLNARLFPATISYHKHAQLPDIRCQLNARTVSDLIRSDWSRIYLYSCMLLVYCQKIELYDMTIVRKTELDGFHCLFGTRQRLKK